MAPGRPAQPASGASLEITPLGGTLLSPLLAFTWIAVGALLLRIAVAGRFNDLASGPVGRSGMVAFVGLLLPALGLVAAAAIPRVGGAWPSRVSQGVGVAVTVLASGLLVLGHDSA